MSKDPFLLVSLEETESKNLAQVISNNTARKILDYLSKHESATESKVAKDLQLALSTVHYNLQALVKAELVQTEEFHYSKKGKEVLHYSLANKLIIIAPKKTKTASFMNKLRGLVPAAIVSLGAAAVIRLFDLFGTGRALSASKLSEPLPMVANYATDAVEEATIEVASAGADEMIRAAPMAAKMAVNETAPMLAEAAPEVAPVIVEVFRTNPDMLAMMFLAGSLFALLAMVVYYFFTSKK